MLGETEEIKKFELSVLMPESSTEGDILDLRDKILKHFIIYKFENDGVKRLAYSISGQDRARYLFFDVIPRENNSPSKLSSELNIDDNVLRYLLVRTSK